jgi:hypothetical protein
MYSGSRERTAACAPIFAPSSICQSSSRCNDIRIIPHEILIPAVWFHLIFLSLTRQGYWHGSKKFVDG